jgi:hypothetical protein
MTEPLMPINAATKRVYWCVRARSEQLDDREAMLNEDAWMVVLDELARLRARLAQAEECIKPFADAYQAMLDYAKEKNDPRIGDRELLFELAKHLNMEMFVNARKAASYMQALASETPSDSTEATTEKDG